MSLYVRVAENRTDVALLVITRTTPPYPVSEYVVALYDDEETSGMLLEYRDPTATATVTHERAKGWLPLVRAALAALEAQG